MILGLLAGPLLGAKVGKDLGQSVKEGHYDKGELIIAIDPSAFGDPSVFLAAVAAHLSELKAMKKAPGVDEIRVPGERGFAERTRRLAGRNVPIEASVWSSSKGISTGARNRWHPGPA